jgi:hypothetical protein
MVRRTGNGYECTVCGQKIECPISSKPQAIIVQSSNHPTIRSVLVNGVEVHRCKIGDLKAD